MKIDVELLCVQFGDTKILKGVDLNVGDREFIGIIGPNGSGKSTLLKCIYRVLEPNAGLIELDGKKLKDYAVKESAKKVAVVAQCQTLCPEVRPYRWLRHTRGNAHTGTYQRNL